MLLSMGAVLLGTRIGDCQENAQHASAVEERSRQTHARAAKGIEKVASALSKRYRKKSPQYSVNSDAVGKQLHFDRRRRKYE